MGFKSPFCKTDFGHDKREADAVLEEKDKAIAELQSKVTLASLAEDCNSLLNKRCNYCSELQRQKYKRCLAMAAWCDSNVYAMKISAMNEVISGCKSFYKNREIWWGKWRDRFHKLERYYKELETEDR